MGHHLNTGDIIKCHASRILLSHVLYKRFVRWGLIAIFHKVSIRIISLPAGNKQSYLRSNVSLKDHRKARNGTETGGQTTLNDGQDFGTAVTQTWQAKENYVRICKTNYLYVSPGILQLSCPYPLLSGKDIIRTAAPVQLRSLFAHLFASEVSAPVRRASNEIEIFWKI